MELIPKSVYSNVGDSAMILKLMVAILYYISLFFILCSPLHPKGYWEICSYGEQYFGYTCIKCIDSANCVVSGNNFNSGKIIRKTTDGGDTWNFMLKDTNHVGYYPPKLNYIAYPTQGFIIGVCDLGFVYRTTDDGNTWDIKQLPEKRT